MDTTREGLIKKSLRGRGNRIGSDQVMRKDLTVEELKQLTLWAGEASR